MILILLYTFLISGILIIFCIDKKKDFLIRFFSLLVSSLVLIVSTLLLLFFKTNTLSNQQNCFVCFNLHVLNFSTNFGLDSLSLLFLVLSSLLIFLCLIFIWNEINYKNYAISLLLIELFLLLIFSSLDLFIFYIFFEAILIPMFLIIGFWGSRNRKVRAVFLFFFYTLCGSLLFLVGIFYLYILVGSCSIEYIRVFCFSLIEQQILWIAFFLSFASKIPMFPFHVWLPEAHVEAPTVGSVLLAGILLKLGVYGFLKYSLVLFPYASLFYSPAVYTFSIIGIIYASFCAIRQTDLKRIIAYSSISHMNLIVLGIFSFNLLGLQGSIFQSLSHGFVSGGMFFLIGIIYARYHTRFLFYYGGLAQTMPLFSCFFLIFTMANIALPGTSSFSGEFLLLLGIYKTNFLSGILSSTGVIFCGAYSLWLCNKILFTNLKIFYTFKFLDIDLREGFILLPLFILIIILGFVPKFIFSLTNFTCLDILFELNQI